MGEQATTVSQSLSFRASTHTPQNSIQVFILLVKAQIPFLLHRHCRQLASLPRIIIVIMTINIFDSEIPVDDAL